MGMSRGFFGIGIYQAKHSTNVGTTFRSGHAMGADFLFTIGRKYSRTSSDTTDATRHLPYFHYDSLQHMLENLPVGCKPIAVEISENSRQLPNFVHPERAAYILGNEVYGLPEKFLKDNMVIQIPTKLCLNVATAGGIVLYDRISKGLKR